jgi:hypothetical protein
VTVNVAEPLIVPEVAVIVADPAAALLASPPLFTVATEFAEEVQVAVLVRFCVVPLLYVPVAVNCCVWPAATEAVAGVTAIEVNAGGVTVKVVEPLMVPDLAVIVAVPEATPVANPVLLLTVATVAFEELQLAVVVRFCVVPLL